MLTPRTIRIASLAAAGALAVAAAAPVSSGPVPVVKLIGTVFPSKGKIKAGTSLTVRIDTRISSVPPGGDLVLHDLDYMFPRGAVTNGRLFPSCSVARIKAAHGVLSVCPKGSQIGSGIATGTAVAIGVKSHGKLTLFNGPGGKSVTMNIDIEHPALIDETWSGPLVKLHGKYALKLSVKIPPTLHTILGGDIVTSDIDVTVGATRVIHGVKRGYTEAVNCPVGGKGPFHADFTFNQDTKASADSTLAC